jgi:hypothetical protein
MATEEGGESAEHEGCLIKLYHSTYKLLDPSVFGVIFVQYICQ